MYVLYSAVLAVVLRDFSSAGASGYHNVPHAHVATAPLLEDETSDCFYASVFEAENPTLRSLPLAVQQKQIVVTCNYEARRRGLYKLQLIKEAKRLCPDVVVVLGEDLTRFRNASKDLYSFLRSFSWNGRVERLGFDEVFLDVTDIVDYNLALLNLNHLPDSFFCLSRTDPTHGFAFDASTLAGSSFVEQAAATARSDSDLALRLRLGSHLAQHLRVCLKEQKGYTATVGISTSKLLSKLVGNVNKPNGQTTLMPPYALPTEGPSNVTAFLDDHDVGKIPGIGFKMAQKIRGAVLGRPAEFDESLVYGGTKENVTVRDVRTHDSMGTELLERVLGGHGAPQGIALRMWGLINGVDDSEVAQAREVPRQISIEDSYLKLDTFEEVQRELLMLSKSLVSRMRVDLVEEDTTAPPEQASVDTRSAARWLAHPRTLRLSTRPRGARNPEGGRSRSFQRISRSAPLPNFVFSLSESVEHLADRLVYEALLPLFRKLHPEKSGWDLSLVNLAVTNMADAAGDGRGATGRDISKMFTTQHEVLGPWKVEDRDCPPHPDKVGPEPKDEASVDLAPHHALAASRGSEDAPTASQERWADDGVEVGRLPQEGVDLDPVGDAATCGECGAVMPGYALLAHQRFHELET